jgi:hypothetical protein
LLPTPMLVVYRYLGSYENITHLIISIDVVIKKIIKNKIL